MKIWLSWRCLIFKGFPVKRAQRNRVTAAIENLRAAAVNIPIPVKLILTATALAPNKMQRKIVKRDAFSGRPPAIGSSFDSWLVLFNAPSCKPSGFRPVQCCAARTSPLKTTRCYQSAISSPNSRTIACFPIASTCALNSCGSASMTGNVL